jgi:hypothetical protein
MAKIVIMENRNGFVHDGTKPVIFYPVRKVCEFNENTILYRLLWFTKLARLISNHTRYKISIYTDICK